jgi:DNA replication protein DnaC
MSVPLDDGLYLIHTGPEKGEQVNPTVADAILDRLVHRAHRIALKGESLRRKPQEKSRIADPS